MYINYIKNGKLLKTFGTNSDIEVIDKSSLYRVNIEIKAKADISLLNANNQIIDNVSSNSLYFFNGYQSWTDTKENTINDKERSIKKVPKFIKNMFGIEFYGDSTFYDYDDNFLHGYDIFYIKNVKEIFSFNYNYPNAYLLYELNKKERKVTCSSLLEGVNLKDGDTFTIFNYSLFHSFIEGKESLYRDYPNLHLKKIFGYTSWYNYYQNINEEIVYHDLDALDNRFNLFQIDDGYETFVGDWLDVDKNKFPNGLKGIVDAIHSKGYLAGIWLAPFVAEEKSKLFNEHPEYFKKQDGKFVKAGGNWSGFYALDLYHEGAREHIRKSLEFFMDLGFDFFKLDFLYAISLPRYDGKTRSMVAEDGYSFLREILKDKLILGCGAIISNSIKKFDYLRIGPDLSLRFDDVWYMRKLHRERISTKITLQNTIYRSLFDDHFFGNDPDVFLLRSENSHLTSKQKKAILLLNSLFGTVLMTSDNLDNYNEDARKDLGRAFEIFFDAKDKTFERIMNDIKIDYVVNNRIGKYIYDPEKGVLRYVGQK